VQRHQGDALIAWENEAQLAVKQLGKDDYEIVYPSVSILAEPPVAVVDGNATKHGTSKVAEAYLRFLYTEQGQEIAAKHYYRPRSKEAFAKYASQFPKIDLVTISDFGGWAKAQPKYFDDGGIFDQIETK
jgi:sulfate/thiosulfate-binding protein